MVTARLIPFSFLFKDIVEEEGDIFDEKFVNGLKEGRTCKGNEYIMAIVLFADVFQFQKYTKSEDFAAKAAFGSDLNSLMSQNEETMLRTVLEIGCGKDWPEYKATDEYKAWENSQNNEHGEKIRKPVSLVDVLWFVCYCD